MLSGEPGLKLASGEGWIDFLIARPAQAASFQAAMSERTAAFASSLAATYDFPRIATSLHRRRPWNAAGRHSHRPAGPARDAVRFAQDRRRIVGIALGSWRRRQMRRLRWRFLATVPEGGDGYILANVLHDWDDDRCRHPPQLSPSDPRRRQVLVVERMIFADPARSIPTLLSDISMLVLTGGQERTTDEYARLFAGAGMRLTRAIPSPIPTASSKARWRRSSTKRVRTVARGGRPTPSVPAPRFYS